MYHKKDEMNGMIKSIGMLGIVSLASMMALLFAGCAVPGSGEANESEPGGGKVINGTEAGAEDEVSGSTVAVVYNESYLKSRKATCSGTLIDDRTVLTAAHCFDYGSDCQVIFGLHVDDPSARSITGKCKAMRPWRTTDEDGMLIGQQDIALVYLDRRAPEAYRPVPYLTLRDELKLGQATIVAGYGVNAYDVDGSRGILRFADEQIESFDDKFMTFSTNPSRNCSGDSGGPAYVRNQGGTLSLVGIVHGGVGYRCNSNGFYTDVRYFTDWIRKTRAELAGEPASSGAAAGTLRDGKCYAYCPNGASDDPDGDGWGFAGNQFCIVKGSTQDSAHPC